MTPSARSHVVLSHVVLSIGSNVEREKNIRFAVGEIKKEYAPLDISPVYETASVGFDGPPFYNLVVGFHCTQPVQQLHARLRYIETAAGRERGIKSSCDRAFRNPAFRNRQVDIDILLYGDHDLREQGYNIPRAEIAEFAYILKPLADLYPHLVPPHSGKTVLDAWHCLATTDQTIRAAEFAVE